MSDEEPMTMQSDVERTYTRWWQANAIAQEACRFPNIPQTERDRLWAIEEAALNEYIKASSLADLEAARGE